MYDSKKDVVELLTVLIKHGAYVNAIDMDVNSIVYAAVQGRQDTKILDVLIEAGADWKITNNQGQNALMRSNLETF